MSEIKLPRLITAEAVSNQTGLSVWKVYELVREGVLPHVRLGNRSIRFNPAAIAEWINGGGSRGHE